jgi:hypothetical protein
LFVCLERENLRENQEAIKKGQSRDTGNNGNSRQNEGKKKIIKEKRKRKPWDTQILFNQSNALSKTRIVFSKKHMQTSPFVLPMLRLRLK